LEWEKFGLVADLLGLLGKKWGGGEAKKCQKSQVSDRSVFYKKKKKQLEETGRRRGKSTRKKGAKAKSHGTSFFDEKA